MGCLLAGSRCLAPESSVGLLSLDSDPIRVTVRGVANVSGFWALPLAFEFLVEMN